MREYYLSKKEMKPLIEQINKNWPEITINKLKNVKATDLKKGRFIITEEFKIIIINGMYTIGIDIDVAYQYFNLSNSPKFAGLK